MKNLDKSLKTIIEFQNDISDFEIHKEITITKSGGSYSYDKEVIGYDILLKFNDDKDS
jgi:hypothetical protein